MRWSWIRALELGYTSGVHCRVALAIAMWVMLASPAVGAAPTASASTAAPVPPVSVETPPDTTFAPQPTAPRPHGRARPRATAVSCSPRLCIHAEDAAAAEHASAALEAGHRALDLLLGLDLPPPLPDGGRGGTLAPDLYLSSGRRRAEAIADGPWPSPFDRAPAFARVSVPAAGPDCMLAHAVTEAMIGLAWSGLDAAPSPATVRAHANYVAHMWSPCLALLATDVDHAQRSPERALLDEPAPLLGWFLEDRYGVGDVGTLSSSLWAIGVQPWSRGTHHHDEPDLFDVLRGVMPHRHKTLGETLLQLAIARAFMGSRSDGLHLIDTAWLGDLGRVRFDWRIAYGSLPRRLAPPKPLAPTGSSYIWLDLDQVPTGHGLTFHAEWEESHVFQWAVVRMDADGRSLGAHITGGVFGAHQATTTLEELETAAALLIVGVHVGNDNRQLAYDPDVGPARVTSYEVTLHPKSP